MNIMSLVMQYFGPVILNKIAGSLGINSTLAQKAIAAAAPAILAGITGRMSQPGGAKILSDLIGKQDPGLLGKLGEMIGTGKQASVVEQGTSALGSLLGNSAVGSLAGALSKQASLGVGASNTLLGLMTPAILGTLGREQKSAGLDAAGLANMLMGQKKNIADVIPGDFAKLLAGTGILDAVQGKTSETVATDASKTATTTTAVRPTGTTTSTMAAKPGTVTGTTTHHHQQFNWMPWLGAIAAASALWWSVFGNKMMQPHPTTATIPAVIAPSTTLATTPTTPLPASVANTEVGKQIVSILDDVRGSISGVRDAATAASSLPRIQDVAGRLEKASSMATQLNPEARRALATYVTTQQGLIKTAITNALALPGVSAVLKPVLEQMLGRVEGLAKA
jgi:uncharacterized membrane protein YfbV (UPF0208 family)